MPRQSLPYPLERADTLPIRQLRRSVYSSLGSPYYAASSTTPTLTDGSTSRSTARSSFSGGGGYGSPSALQPLPFIDVYGTQDPRFHGQTPYATSVDAYPFPNMVARQRPSTTGQLVYSANSPSTPYVYDESSVYRKRPSPSLNDYRPHTTSHIQTAFGNFSFHSSTNSPYPVPPPPPPHDSSTPVAPNLERRGTYPGADYRPSTTSSVFGVDGSRQLYLPAASSSSSSIYDQLNLLPPLQQQQRYVEHEDDGMKKRRMSTHDRGEELSRSMSTRRESTSTSALQLEGLPVPPPGTVIYSGFEEQQHHYAAAATAVVEDGYDVIPYPQVQQAPRPLVLSSSQVSSGLARSQSAYTYASFASPTYLDRVAPLPSLDSPLDGSPRKPSSLSPPQISLQAFDGGSSLNPFLPHQYQQPHHQHQHQQQQQHQHDDGSSCYSYHNSTSYDQLPVPPPLDLTYPTTPHQPGSSSDPAASTSSSSTSTSTSATTTFNDPSYPSTATSPYQICHSRPPASDFSSPPLGGLPYEQRLRFDEDQYTPLWVRFDRTNKEGWCALCPGEGKWLCLKNSAFWYHRQFIHGVSSSSGHYFLPPLELRQETENGKILGLCHSCAEWHPYQSATKASSRSAAEKPPSQWFHHAHKCHTYFSPRKEATKNARFGI